MITKKMIIASVLIALALSIIPGIDIALWRLDVSKNKAILAEDIESIVATPLDIRESCGSNTTKGFTSTSCRIWAEIVLPIDESMETSLENLFLKLNAQSWDASREELKTQLITGKSTMRDQTVRFYHETYDPNGDHDFIDVQRVDNGLTVADSILVNNNHDSELTNVITVRFQRHQRSSILYFLGAQ